MATVTFTDTYGTPLEVGDWIFIEKHSGLKYLCGIKAEVTWSERRAMFECLYDTMSSNVEIVLSLMDFTRIKSFKKIPKESWANQPIKLRSKY